MRYPTAVQRAEARESIHLELEHYANLFAWNEISKAQFDRERAELEALYTENEE